MGPKKKDLEIVYNLQWKNRPTNTDDKSNMVGIYDIPATTLNWETFKSYLLKNSGTTGNDVKVWYVDSDKQEMPIDSQKDFQIALYSIRQRARMGEIINLKLDRIGDQRNRFCKMTSSSDAQVQVEVDAKHKQFEQPPEWFMKYMKQFKEEIVEEVTTLINGNSKTYSVTTQSHHSRKPKNETKKRIRKATLYPNEINNEKEIRKTLKLERRLENKLEKLEHKTFKIKAKKLALGRSSDSDIGRSCSKSRPIGLPLTDSDLLMDASAVSQFDQSTPHLNGGEKFMQNWVVINSGKLPWTNETELRYAWGSQALMPVEKRVACPPLQPGEKGSVVVLLNIPETAGNYECYWHFYHKSRRFGHWLGCQIIVDESAAKKYKYDIINIGDKYELVLPAKQPLVECHSSPTNSLSKTGKVIDLPDHKINSLSITCLPTSTPLDLTHDNEKINNVNISEEIISKQLNNLRMHGVDLGSDSDNQSIVSLADSNTSLSSVDEFVFIAVPQAEQTETTTEIIKPGIYHEDDNNNELAGLKVDRSSSESISKIQESPVNLSIKSESFELVPEASAEIEMDSGYAYVCFEGKKIPMPKKYLRPDYLSTAEDAPDPVNQAIDLSLSTASQTCSLSETNNVKDSRNDFIKFSDSSEVEQSFQLQKEKHSCTLQPPTSELLYPSLEQHRITERISDTAAEIPIQTGTDIHLMDPYFSHNGSMSASCGSAVPVHVDFEPNNYDNLPSVNNPRVTSPCSGRNTAESHCQFNRYNSHSSMVHTCNSSLPRNCSYTNSGQTNRTGRFMSENVLTGAAILASSAINTARNVLNMVAPQRKPEVGWWENGRWISTNSESPRDIALRTLEEMGFWDRDYNATLLARYDDDITRVIAELVQP